MPCTRCLGFLLLPSKHDFPHLLWCSHSSIPYMHAIPGFLQQPRSQHKEPGKPIEVVHEMMLDWLANPVMHNIPGGSIWLVDDESSDGDEPDEFDKLLDKIESVFNTPEGFHNLMSGKIERVRLDPATLVWISEGPRTMPEVVSSCIIIPIAHPMACDEFPRPFGAHLEEARWPYGDTAYEGLRWPWPCGHMSTVIQFVHWVDQSICDRMSTTLPSGVICTFRSPSAPPDHILLRCFINILLDLWSQNSILEPMNFTCNWVHSHLVVKAIFNSIVES
ncbi:hypothetical protein EDC04DRAFT_2603667 [Pisolithus marmoratus]|nr:hypothetical protein EDC04DRAFT_2603667 [Pisolithus marmoratus]